MRQQQNGFILVTTLIISTLFIFLATYISYRTTTFTAFATTTVNREKAYLLARGGIQIGISQLVNMDEDRDIQKNKKDNAALQAKQLLYSILPGLNRWQTFNLKEERDGIDGQIKVAVSSEDGKIDINSIYNFDTHTFVGEGMSARNWKTGMQVLFARIARQEGGENLFEAFEQFLKQREHPLDDLTELVTVKAFKKLQDHLFYNPPETEQEDRPLYLTDLFTVWSGKPTVQPWLFSDSVCAILELQRAKSGDIDKRRASVRQWLRDFKLKTLWSVDWDNLMIPLYGKDYSSLPKDIDTIFSSDFDPHFFSILAEGIYNDVSQRLLAIVERIKTHDQSTDTFEVKIRKLYWL